MKGQYRVIAEALAFLFSFSLIFIGTFILFQKVIGPRIEERAFRKHAELIYSMVNIELKSCEDFRGEIRVQLPNTIAGKPYTLEFNGTKLIIKGVSTFEKELEGIRWNLSGVHGSGSDLIIVCGENITIR